MSPVIFLISSKEEFLYFGITSNKNSGSTFFIAIEILFSFLILDNFFENQEVFKSLKYGGEKFTTWVPNTLDKDIILSTESSSNHLEDTVIDKTFIQIESDNHLI